MKTKHARMIQGIPTEPGLYWGGPTAEEAFLLRVKRHGKGFRYCQVVDTDGYRSDVTYKKAEVVNWLWSRRILEPAREQAK